MEHFYLFLFSKFTSRKLDDPSGPYSALVLAVAGVERMGWGSRVEEVLEEDVCMHAVGQVGGREQGAVE